LATSPEAPLQNPERAVQLAQKAVTLEPARGAYHNTLGVACYRAGQWQDAVAALKKSMHLQSGGDCLDWFFLAMAHHRLGDEQMARDWYGRAAQWMDQHKSQDEELRRFRAEADALLGGAVPDN
jgi:uncharacterized protein HemY